MIQSKLNKKILSCTSFIFLYGCGPLIEEKNKPCYTKLDVPPPIISRTSLSRPKKLSPYPPIFKKKVSLSLSGKVPLRHAFFELARQSGLNIILDHSLSQKMAVLYHAYDQPLGNIIDNLCSSAGLRYYFDHNALYICDDTPYFRTHTIQFLSGFRKTQTQTSVKTDVFAEGLNPQKGMTDNGASILLNTSHTVDFWDELEKNIQLILGIGKNVSQDNSSYSINRYAGILSVRATEKQHRALSAYLSQLQKLVTAQILIEAKIIEIDLLDEYKGGVNWNMFIQKNAPLRLLDKSGELDHSRGLTASSSQGNYTFRLQNSHLNALATFMEKFGTVRTLANPRQTVINNQSAVLKVAHNEVFFELQLQDYIDPHHTSYLTHQKAQSRIQTIPIGLILYVHPSLNAETGEIIVSLHPTISRVVGTKSDPAASLYSSRAVESSVPIVQVREMDSVIVAREGQVIVTGGLMEERSFYETTGIPGLSHIPVLGELFKYKEKKRQMTELVILLKLSVVREGGGMSEADTRLYDSFTKDPRPLFEEG